MVTGTGSKSMESGRLSVSISNHKFASWSLIELKNLPPMERSGRLARASIVAIFLISCRAGGLVSLR